MKKIREGSTIYQIRDFSSGWMENNKNISNPYTIEEIKVSSVYYRSSGGKEDVIILSKGSHSGYYRPKDVEGVVEGIWFEEINKAKDYIKKETIKILKKNGHDVLNSRYQGLSDLEKRLLRIEKAAEEVKQDILQAKQYIELCEYRNMLYSNYKEGDVEEFENIVEKMIDEKYPWHTLE